MARSHLDILESNLSKLLKLSKNMKLSYRNILQNSNIETLNNKQEKVYKKLSEYIIKLNKKEVSPLNHFQPQKIKTIKGGVKVPKSSSMILSSVTSDNKIENVRRFRQRQNSLKLFDIAKFLDNYNNNQPLSNEEIKTLKNLSRKDSMTLISLKDKTSSNLYLTQLNNFKTLKPKVSLYHKAATKIKQDEDSLIPPNINQNIFPHFVPTTDTNKAKYDKNNTKFILSRNLKNNLSYWKKTREDSQNFYNSGIFNMPLMSFYVNK